MRSLSRMVVSSVALVVASLTFASVAYGHIHITYPLPRYSYVNPDDPVQKTSFCGSAGIQGLASSVVTELGAGEETTVTWSETIDHPSHFRVALDLTGTDAYADPTSADDQTVSGNIIAYIEDAGGSTFSHTFTLPDAECDPCSLQVIQVMTDKLANGFGNDDIYYWCSDITIRSGGGPTSSSGSSSTSSGATTSSAGSGAGGGPVSGALDDDSGCAMSPRTNSPAALILLAFAAMLLGRTVVAGTMMSFAYNAVVNQKRLLRREGRQSQRARRGGARVVPQRFSGHGPMAAVTLVLGSVKGTWTTSSGPPNGE